MNHQHQTIQDEEHDDTQDAPPIESPVLTQVIGDGDKASRRIEHTIIEPESDWQHPSSEIDQRNEWNERIDGECALTKSELFQMMGEAFREVIDWVGDPKDPVQVRRRLRVLAYMLQPATISLETMKQLAIEEHCTTANISAIAGQFRDRFHFAAPTMRGEEGRKNMSNAQIGNANARRK